MRGRLLALRWGLVLVVTLIVVPANAAQQTLGLIAVPPTLRDAVVVALEPWNVRIIELRGPVPSSLMPAAAREARATTQAESLGAVAWLTSDASGNTLWLYDAENDQTISRPVSGEPDDDAAAAALALTLKTLLRGSALAPVITTTESRGTATRAPLFAHLRLEAEGGLRLAAVDDGKISARIGVGVAAWPAVLGGRLGAFLRVEEGLGVSVANAEFHGRLSDHDFGVGLRARFPVGELLRFEPGIGGTAHFTTLDGAPIDGRGPIDLTRLDASVDLSAALLVPLGRFEVGFRMNGAFWTRWQRYRLDEGSSFEVAPVQVSSFLVLGAVLD